MGDLRATDTWTAVLGELQLQVTRPTYDTWLRDTKGLSFTDDLLTVGVPTPFAVEWLERRMYQLVQRTAQKVTSLPVEILFQVGSATAVNGDDQISRDDGPPPRRTVQPLANKLNGKYTFSNFVEGPSNRLPYSAARAVAESPGRSYNPLFIYSGVGLGKTHLLHAIGHSCVRRRLSFIYATCEQFTNEFISAIRTRTTEDFRARYRSVEVLLIDDIHFISGKEQTQEGFFHTFNDLHISNRQVVLASDRPPKALSLLEDRLRSRFEWGLIADIQPPDLETRMAILRSKAEQMEVSLDDRVLEYIAQKVRNNVRELEGSLNHMKALAPVTGCPITLDLAAEAITHFVHDSSLRSVDPDNIMSEVSAWFKVSKGDLIGRSRKKEIVRARHVAMYLLHEELRMKDTEIGRLMGGRDHSTVISAVGKLNHQLSLDPLLRHDVQGAKEAIFT